MATPEQIQAALDKISDQVKAQADLAEKEIKANARLSEETRANVDKLLIQQGELMARLQSAEQLVASLEQGGGRDARPMTAGEEVVNHEDVQAFLKNPRGSVRVPVSAAVTTASTGGAIRSDRVPGIVTAPEQRLTIRDLLSWGRTTSNSVDFVRETGFTNSAAPVSENPAAGKPQSDITLELDTASVATIAHWLPASKQVLADMPMLQSYIEGRLMYGLKLVEEAQLLKGSGTGLNIDGIFTQASSYANPGVAVVSETRIDRLRLALLQVELAEYWGDGIVLNPIDWANIELLKTSTEHQYLFANPRGITAPSLWGRPVIPTKALAADEFLVGAFAQGAQGWDREDATVLISLEDRDNFIKNMVTILVEERLALTVYRPESFVKGTFDDLNPGS